VKIVRYTVKKKLKLKVYSICEGSKSKGKICMRSKYWRKGGNGGNSIFSEEELGNVGRGRGVLSREGFFY
jgi:hypothetical protein